MSRGTESMGFFAWIREGVRRAVLLGFSDAVTQIGTRTADEDLSPHLAVALQQSLAAVEGADSASAKIAGPSTGPVGTRKRLGRSLDQIRDSAS